jgi:hypothetical protein
VKLRALVCALFSVLVAAPRGQAQILKPTLGAGGGLALPAGNTSNIDNSGYNVLVFGGLESSLLPFGIRVDGSFVHLPVKFDAGHDNVWSATANAVFHIPAPLVSPYFIGGLGYYYQDVSPGLGTSSSNFGLNAGIGAKLHIPLLFSVFGEFRYHYVFSARPNMQYFPLTFGIQL